MPQKGASATERLRPATDKQIAVELEKLRAVFGYEAGAWDTAVPLYMDALSDLPYDLLKEAVADAIRTAGPDSRFPRPGELREFVRFSFERRKAQARTENRPRSEEEWPDWLRDIWGPLPDGRVERNRWLEDYKKREIEANARLLRESPHAAEFQAQDAERAAMLEEIRKKGIRPGERTPETISFVALCVKQITQNLSKMKRMPIDPEDELEVLKEDLGVSAKEAEIPIPHDEPAQQAERRKQINDYIAGRTSFRGQREMTKEEADAALDNLQRSLGRKPI